MVSDKKEDEAREGVTGRGWGLSLQKGFRDEDPRECGGGCCKLESSRQKEACPEGEVNGK